MPLAEGYGGNQGDVAGFIKNAHETAWQFIGLLLIREGRVAFKLSSGLPNLNRHDEKLRPPGPLQKLGGLLLLTAERSR